MNSFEKKIEAIEQRIDKLESQLDRIVEFVDGRYDENDNQHYGGLNGFGGDLNRLRWLQERVDHLINRLDLRFKGIGERMNWDDFIYNQGIEHEVNENHLSPKPRVQERKLP